METVFSRFAEDLKPYTDPDAAVARIGAIYQYGADQMRRAHDLIAEGNAKKLEAGAGDLRYPYVGISVGPGEIDITTRRSYGVLHDPGNYATTLTRPDLFGGYYREQLALLLSHHKVPVWVGISNRPMPLPFVISSATTAVTPSRMREMLEYFAMPDLGVIDDAIANGSRAPQIGDPKPLALFGAERVDFSIHRLPHYTGTSVKYFQRFVLLTNYQRYVEAFRAFARKEVENGVEYSAFVEPGDVRTSNPNLSQEPASGETPQYLPQMPAYHLVRPDGNGITMVNIGVGPANAKTITDHIAVLRPHCWIMLGHCAGLRRSQFLGDYVLAHAYARDDHVLDGDVPQYVPIPPIAEIQVAMQEAVARVTGLKGRDLKTRMRTGTVYTTDDRHWELRYRDLYPRLYQTRAIAVDMESATIAANGYRFRVPYGTLLCVSDKPYHGELKTKDAADSFYRERVRQHLIIGIETMRVLREGIDTLHSRKLRSFDEPPFR
jgi:AMP nucleosidase